MFDRRICFLATSHARHPRRISSSARAYHASNSPREAPVNTNERLLGRLRRIARSHRSRTSRNYSSASTSCCEQANSRGEIARKPASARVRLVPEGRKAISLITRCGELQIKSDPRDSCDLTARILPATFLRAECYRHEESRNGSKLSISGTFGTTETILVPRSGPRFAKTKREKERDVHDYRWRGLKRAREAYPFNP